MSTKRRLALLAVAAIAAGLTLSACSSVDGPVELVPSQRIQKPQPFGVKVGKAALRGLPQPDTSCGDPTASLPPDPAATGDAISDIKRYGKLKVGVDNSTYLFGFRDPKTGDLEGFDVGIARDMAKAILGDPKKIEFKEIDSAHRVPALRSGDVDMVIRTMTITCKRAGQVAFSTPYFAAQQRVLVPSDSLANGLSSLGGKKVCATAGSTSLRRIAAAESGPVPVSVPDWSDCLVLLQQREVAAVSTDDTILAGMHAQDPDTKIVGPAVATEPYGIAVPKKDEALLRRVNAELDAIRGNGTWQGLYDKWIGDRLGRAAGMPPANYQG
jgi:polar amino acid transport system substrate-binding protein